MYLVSSIGGLLENDHWVMVHKYMASRSSDTISEQKRRQRGRFLCCSCATGHYLDHEDISIHCVNDDIY